MECSRCKSLRLIKNGIVRTHQLYLCKSCGYNSTVTQKSTASAIKVKQQALQMYLETKKPLITKIKSFLSL
jgi:transposase-like protein